MGGWGGVGGKTGWGGEDMRVCMCVRENFGEGGGTGGVFDSTELVLGYMWMHTLLSAFCSRSIARTLLVNYVLLVIINATFLSKSE